MQCSECKLLFAASLTSLLFLLPPRASSASTHFAIVGLSGDPYPMDVQFTPGTSNPAGQYDVNIANGSPGFLKGTSGSGGNLTITPPGQNTTQFAALAIHVADSTGPSHSLSSLNDPALADLITDLNQTPLGTPLHYVTAYPFNAAPQQFADAVNSLSLGESALGGQPFDILLTANNPGFNRWWILDLRNEINTLDGITSISVTDVGAVPEPSALLCLLIPTLLLPRRRHR